MVILLRSIAFNGLFYLNTFLFLIIALPTFFMPYRAIIAVAKSWGRVESCSAACRCRYRLRNSRARKNP